VPGHAWSHLSTVTRFARLTGGPTSMTESPAVPTTPMHPLTGQLAAVMASTDAVPRLLRQFTDLFLVTPKGAVWRVYDSAEPSGAMRYPSSDDAGATARVFIGGGATQQIRVYLFKDGEPRTISADKLHEQLSASMLAIDSKP
jgi:hypothetical protein